MKKIILSLILIFSCTILYAGIGDLFKKTTPTPTSTPKIIKKKVSIKAEPTAKPTLSEDEVGKLLNNYLPQGYNCFFGYLDDYFTNRCLYLLRNNYNKNVLVNADYEYGIIRNAYYQTSSIDKTKINVTINLDNQSPEKRWVTIFIDLNDAYNNKLNTYIIYENSLISSYIAEQHDESTQYESRYMIYLKPNEVKKISTSIDNIYGDKPSMLISSSREYDFFTYILSDDFNKKFVIQVLKSLELPNKPEPTLVPEITDSIE